MKLKNLTGLSSALCLCVPLCGISLAQETNKPADFEQRLKQMQEMFEQREHAMEARFEKKIAAQDAEIGALKKQIASPWAAPAAAESPNRSQVPDLIKELNDKVDSVVAAQKNSATAAPQFAVPWSPAQPITVARAGSSYMNISLDGLFAAGGSTAKDIPSLQLGGHDPNQRGFTVQNVEAVFEGFVDPYFRGQANIIYQIDARGESVVELEEAYVETISLPRNLQLKAGQYFTEFGRLNPTHPHAWSFVDLPLVNGRFFGGDGLRSAGARLSWLMPTPFYSELFLSVQNSQGETAQSFRNEHEGGPFLGRLHTAGRVKSFGDLLFVPRYAASFDLTDSQTLLLGASAAFGPNASGANTDTQIYGVDLFWKWKSPRHDRGFPFVSWQTEAMVRRFKAGASTTVDLDGDGAEDFVPGETLTDYGFYSQIAWGFKSGWVANLRGDWVSSDVASYERLYGRDADRATRWRISPNLTWYPSEFSKLRLQYNYDQRQGIGPDHSIWLQLEFLLGSHGAHKF